MKILIVDDDTASRMMLGERLRRFGHEVMQACDGEDAWALLLAGDHDVLVSDVVMPNGSGIELVQRVRAHDDFPHYIYTILLTAYGGREAFLAGMEAGADDFLTKPYDLEQLAARLRVAERILGLQSRVRQLEGILPICSTCKKIRDEDDQWERMEDYITERTDALFSHGLCPDCYAVAMKSLE